MGACRNRDGAMSGPRGQGEVDMRHARAPERSELDPIEVAGRDALAALQLERLQWTLRHVYHNVPH